MTRSRFLQAFRAKSISDDAGEFGKSVPDGTKSVHGGKPVVKEAGEWVADTEGPGAEAEAAESAAAWRKADEEYRSPENEAARNKEWAERFRIKRDAIKAVMEMPKGVERNKAIIDILVKYPDELRKWNARERRGERGFEVRKRGNGERVLTIGSTPVDPRRDFRAISDDAGEFGGAVPDGTHSVHGGKPVVKVSGEWVADTKGGSSGHGDSGEEGSKPMKVGSIPKLNPFSGPGQDKEAAQAWKRSTAKGSKSRPVDEQVTDAATILKGYIDNPHLKSGDELSAAASTFVKSLDAASESVVKGLVESITGFPSRAKTKAGDIIRIKGYLEKMIHNR